MMVQPPPLLPPPLKLVLPSPPQAMLSVHLEAIESGAATKMTVTTTSSRTRHALRFPALFPFPYLQTRPACRCASDLASSGPERSSESTP